MTMTNTLMICLERASDPWALALISLVLSGLIVVAWAITVDASRGHLYFNDHGVEPRNDDQFFDKITEFRNEI